ncbi:MAG: hypothetical protein LBN10_02035 [Propionibacteriaceae bacterium]|jgi:hypothetical protein|nr:hypothetical protein [Propionibacteriaceae bacterium]
MSDLPTWVLPTSVAVGVIILALVVFLLVRAMRHRKTTPNATDHREVEAHLVSDFADSGEAEPVHEESAGASADAVPELHAPTIPASQAVGLGWIRAADLAAVADSEPNQTA